MGAARLVGAEEGMGGGAATTAQMEREPQICPSSPYRRPSWMSRRHR
jgi:hypothetical protein